jgi:hypothetical protein
MNTGLYLKSTGKISIYLHEMCISEIINCVKLKMVYKGDGAGKTNMHESDDQLV